MSEVQAVDAALLERMPLPWPGEDTDKDSRGKVLVAGGSATSAGAVTLSGVSALRAGAGKVMLAVPQFLSLAIAVDFPEAGVEGFVVTEQGVPALPASSERIGELMSKADACLIGPGLADETSAQRLAQALLQTTCDVTCVIDAMCITGLWNQQQALSRHRGKVIITPHPGEMAALTGFPKERITAEPVLVAEEVAGRLQCIVVLKGSATVIAQPDGSTYRYEGGGVGLATSGSGDVLAGVLAGLIARGTKPVEAAIWSVYLHGEAGRRLAERIGPVGFLARELPAEIPGLMAEHGARARPASS